MALMEERRNPSGSSEEISVKGRRASDYQFTRSSASSPLSVTRPARRAGKTAVRSVTVGNSTLNLPAIPPAPAGLMYECSKRAFDATAATALILFLTVPMMAIAFLIFLEDRGPIFYYQTRVGKNGQQFRFFKFRSMVRNADAIKSQLMRSNEADGPIFKMKNDPRVTRIGRFIRRTSMDELPQLFNVLCGDMSLVGPRPHLPREVEKYTGQQFDRLTVQPGLLCFREVLGRSELSFEQWIELDLLYIQYRGVATDINILARTLPAIIKAHGAY